MTICKVNGCDRVAKERGYCRMHAQRVRKHGEPGPAHSLRGMTLEQTFRRYAVAGDPGECWEWAGALNAYGYGVFGTPQVKAHRFALERTGIDVPEDMQACHTCDNRKCINPAHLYMGTLEDNQRDKRVRRRVAGVRHPQAAITSADLDKAAALRLSGASYAEIANEIGVSRSVVYTALTGRSKYFENVPDDLRGDRDADS